MTLFSVTVRRTHGRTKFQISAADEAILALWSFLNRYAWLGLPLLVLSGDAS
jgi:hypothetical protein